MKARFKLSLVAAALAASAAAHAATCEDGLRYKREQKLPQAAAAFSEVLQREPGNLQALENLAVVQGWMQHYDESIASWRAAIRQRPHQPDYHVGLARVLYWKGEHRASLAELDQALAARPGYYDALVLKGDVLMVAGRPQDAREQYLAARQRPEAAGDEALARKLDGAAGPLAWRIDAGYTHDSFSALRGGESSNFAQLGRRLGGGLSLYGRYENYHQFGKVDFGGVLGGYWLAAPQWLLNVELGSKLDDADFRPENLLLANLEWLREGSLQALLGYRYFKYPNSDVHTLAPGLRWLAAPATFEVRYGWSENVDGSNTGVFSVRAGAELGRAAPYLAFAAGEEALPPQARAGIRVYGAGCVWSLARNWGLRLDYSYEDRKNFYAHHAIGGGLTHRF